MHVQEKFYGHLGLPLVLGSSSGYGACYRQKLAIQHEITSSECDNHRIRYRIAVRGRITRYTWLSFGDGRGQYVRLRRRCIGFESRLQ